MRFSSIVTVVLMPLAFVAIQLFEGAESGSAGDYVIGIITFSNNEPASEFTGSAVSDETSFAGHETAATEYRRIDSVEAALLYVVRYMVNVTRAAKKANDITINILGTSLTLRRIFVDSHCDANGLLKTISQTREKVDAYVIGDAFSYCMKETGDGRSSAERHSLFCDAADIICNSWKVPCISWSCPPKTVGATSPGREVAPHLKLFPNPHMTVRSVLVLVRRFHWRNVAMLAADDTEPWKTVCGLIRDELLDATSQFSLVSYQTMSFDKSGHHSFFNETSFRNTTDRLRNTHSKVIILCLPTSSTKGNDPRSSRDDYMKTVMGALKRGVEKEEKAYIWVDPVGKIFDYELLQRIVEVESANATRMERTKRSTLSRKKRIAPVEVIVSRIKEYEKNQTDTGHAEGRHANIDKSTDTHSGETDDMNNISGNIDGFRNDKHRARSPRWASNTTHSATPRHTDANHLFANTMLVSPAIGHSGKFKLEEYLRNKNVHLQDSPYPPVYVHLVEALSLFLASVKYFSAHHVTIDSSSDSRRLFQFIQRMKFSVESRSLFPESDSKSKQQMKYYVYNYFNLATDQNVDNVKLVPMVEILCFGNSTSDGVVTDVVPGGLAWSVDGVPKPDTDCDISDLLCHVTTTKFRPIEFFMSMLGSSMLNFLVYGVWKFLRRKQAARDVAGNARLFYSQEDIQLLCNNGSQVKSRKSIDFGSNTSRLGSTITIAEHIAGVTGDNVLASLDGEIVFVKRLSVGKMESWKSSKDLLKTLSEIRHENLCYYHGFYCGSSIQGMVMEYCTRRSLQDLIQNKEYKLDISFKISLLHDLVKGMKYIHGSALKYHGRLKSSNCLVDSRFVLKVSDYGVNKLYSALENPSETGDSAAALLWTAPELLLDEELRKRGTQKGDSYSFAIICQEIFLRGAPYCTTELSPEEIIEKVKAASPVTRPLLPADFAPAEIAQITKQCWQQQPELRLTFSVINAELKRMNKGNKHNIVENMMRQLEEYSGQLEELVLERTVELDEEKKKTEQLLVRMLPPSVARMLMADECVVPETFDNCTIYFSDICGFTTLSVMSTPMQVVDLLNDLYSCFDAVIEKYDVYKVETIGDAYMVSSGLPNRIGDRHASEAAIMALDILSATTTFRIRHLPQAQLKIRVGLHSGSAVAGVVGLTMPRYCLFGDTINTASRLESTGIPSRIQISEVTRNLLEESGMGFQTEKRGVTELKGRGSMVTWWLTGKDGWTGPMPEPGDVDAPSHGIDINEVGNTSPIPGIANSSGASNEGTKPPPTSNTNANNNIARYPMQSICSIAKLKLMAARKRSELTPVDTTSHVQFSRYSTKYRKGPQRYEMRMNRLPS